MNNWEQTTVFIQKMNTLFKAAKILTYIGAILVAVFVALIGIIKVEEPPYIIFYIAMVFVGSGVLLGNVYVFLNMKKNKQSAHEIFDEKSNNKK